VKPATHSSAHPALQAEDVTVQLKDGRTLRVLQSGEGPPVVLIHGILGMAEDMASGLFEALSPSHRVIAVDRPGHGGSLRHRFESSPTRQAELIREGLAQLGIGTPVLVGHSIGGTVALAYARAWPEEVRGLVLLAPPAYPELRPIEHTYLSPRAAPWFGPLVSRAAHDMVDPAVLPLLQKAMFAPQDIPDYWATGFPHAQVLRPEQMTANGEDISEQPALAALAMTYRAIPTPTVILTGDKDGIVNPSRHARALAVALPNARLEMLPGLGHMNHHFAQAAIAAAVSELTSADPAAA
jgi:pimeloyl-ACP methyl ester carboxylesterase